MGCSVSIHSGAARCDVSVLPLDDAKPHASDAFENTDGSLFARDASDVTDDNDGKSTAFTRSQCFTAPGETYDEPPAAMVENEIRFRVARARRVHGITDDPLQFKPPELSFDPHRSAFVADWLRGVAHAASVNDVQAHQFVFRGTLHMFCPPADTNSGVVS